MKRHKEGSGMLVKFISWSSVFSLWKCIELDLRYTYISVHILYINKKAKNISIVNLSF